MIVWHVRSLRRFVEPSLLLGSLFYIIINYLTLVIISHWIFMTVQVAKCPLRFLSSGVTCPWQEYLPPVA